MAILASVNSCRFFLQARPETRSQLARVATSRLVKPRTAVFQEHDEANALFVVAAGSVKAANSVFTKNEWFGDASLVVERGTERGVTASAGAKGAILICITRDDFHRTVLGRFDAASPDTEVKRRCEVMSQMEPFRACARPYVATLAFYMRPRIVPRGEDVHTQGARSQTLAIVARGEALLRRVPASQTLLKCDGTKAGAEIIRKLSEALHDLASNWESRTKTLRQLQRNVPSHGFGGFLSTTASAPATCADAEAMRALLSDAVSKPDRKLSAPYSPATPLPTNSKEVPRNEQRKSAVLSKPVEIGLVQSGSLVGDDACMCHADYAESTVAVSNAVDVFLLTREELVRQLGWEACQRARRDVHLEVLESALQRRIFRESRFHELMNASASNSQLKKNDSQTKKLVPLASSRTFQPDSFRFSPFAALSPATPAVPRMDGRYSKFVVSSPSPPPRRAASSLASFSVSPPARLSPIIKEQRSITVVGDVAHIPTRNEFRASSAPLYGAIRLSIARKTKTRTEVTADVSAAFAALNMPAPALVYVPRGTRGNLLSHAFVLLPGGNASQERALAAFAEAKNSLRKLGANGEGERRRMGVSAAFVISTDLQPASLTEVRAHLDAHDSWHENIFRQEGGLRDADEKVSSPVIARPILPRSKSALA